jgi:GT2 family glycosyltransferase
MLADCVRSLERQSFRDFEVIVVDNSGARLVRNQNIQAAFRLIENAVNAGFGRAINQAAALSSARYLATLNDDAVAQPRWLEALVTAMDGNPRVGMCASQVRLHPQGTVDSAGMLICRDGSSKQRAHGQPPSTVKQAEPALLPSGSAALYRREMFDQVGGFDDDFFLYCEDTDLGLRARWSGWECVYVPDAVVEHRYSQSAGRASALKAYYVERNRIAVAVKNFPARMLLVAPFVTIARYFWHVVALLRRRGVAGEFHSASNALLLPWFVLRAHTSALIALPALLRKRRQVRTVSRISPSQFCDLARAHSISARQVAEL